VNEKIPARAARPAVTTRISRTQFNRDRGIESATWTVAHPFALRNATT
jgi:hypothetical protein